MSDLIFIEMLFKYKMMEKSENPMKYLREYYQDIEIDDRAIQEIGQVFPKVHNINLDSKGRVVYCICGYRPFGNSVKDHVQEAFKTLVKEFGIVINDMIYYDPVKYYRIWISVYSSLE
jgi:hypothetical protein